MESEGTDNSNSDFLQKGKSTMPTKFNEKEVTPQQLAKSPYFQEIFNEEELDLIHSTLSETKVNCRVKCSIEECKTLELLSNEPNVIHMFLQVPLEARKRNFVQWQHNV